VSTRPDAAVRARPAADEPVLVRKTLVYRLCSVASWVFCKVWHRLEVRGLEHLPRTGAFVLVSNHQSHVDIPIYGGVVPRHVSFVARDTLADAAWLAFVMRQCGAILIQRDSSDRRALRAMAAHLEQGDCVAIFPEGTRTDDGSLREFKGGAVLVARMAKVPMVPAGISGANIAFPRGTSFPRPKKIRLAFGPPIDSALPDALERVESAVAQLVGVPSPRAGASSPLPPHAGVRSTVADVAAEHTPRAGST
jgi:1-acyl-sn-glycerol-3-phosphate acyltransferase